ncbi:hypothetical protein SFB10_2479 [Serratia liquefaciens]|nr:hypothetical protein SFB10_2479 [Serratia liquefaciens]
MNINIIMITISLITGITALTHGHAVPVVSSLALSMINAMHLYHEGYSKLWASLALWSYFAIPAFAIVYLL